MNKNAWRWGLDPRDPDYMDPPTAEDIDDGPEPDHGIDSVDDTDPRNAGPWNYLPMRDQ